MDNMKYTVLLVDDDPVDQQLTIRALAKSAPRIRFKVETAGTLSEAIKLLGTKSYDVILLDPGLPDSNGISTVKKAHEANSRIPIVVLTGLEDEETGLEALREGAEDYLVKEEGLEQVLTRTIRYSIERKQVEEELKLAKKRAEAANKAKSQFLV